MSPKQSRTTNGKRIKEIAERVTKDNHNCGNRRREGEKKGREGEDRERKGGRVSEVAYARVARKELTKQCTRRNANENVVPLSLFTPSLLFPLPFPLPCSIFSCTRN